VTREGESMKKAIAVAWLWLALPGVAFTTSASAENTSTIQSRSALGVLHPASTAHRSRRAHASIVKGTTASIAAFPWLAFIEYRGARAPFSCTGTVIAPRLVLTAGHCVLNPGGGILPGSNYQVFTGTADVKSATATNVSGVDQALIFPGYDPSKALNDAGILILSTPIAAPALPLATLSDESLLTAGTSMAIAGWGLTSGNSNRVPTVLRQAETVIQSSGYCKQKTRQFLPSFTPESQFCAISPPKFEVGSCGGDSGGPGIAQREDGSLVQVGIIDLGVQGCNTRVPEILVRVDRISSWAASWIAAVEFGGPLPAVKIPKVVLPRLAISDAKRFAAFGLAEDFRYRFFRGKYLEIRCGRVEREKVKCGVAWYQGGNDYYGTITIYYGLDREGGFWSYRYKIHWVDDYCWFYSGHRQTCVIRTQTR
jgi:hypothetical protein